MNFKNLILIITIFLAISPLGAQENTAQINPNFFGRVVSEFNIEGQKEVPYYLLPKTYKTKPGLPLNSQNLESDLRDLYLTGVFSDVRATAQKVGTELIITIKLTENPKIARIDYLGMSKFKPVAITNRLKNKPGNVMNTTTIDEDISYISNRYYEEGHKLFYIKQVYLNDKDILVFEISEGQIGKVRIEGLETIKEWVIRRELDQKEGKVLDSEKLGRDRDRITRTGFFTSVSTPKLEETSSENVVDITYQVRERKLNLVDVGLEQLRNEDGIAAFAQYRTRNLFLYTDETSIKTQYRLSKNQPEVRSYNLSYRQPWLFNKTPISGAINIWRELRNEPFSGETNTVANKRDGITGKLTFPINREILSLSTIAKHETVEERGGLEFTPYEINSLTGVLNYDTRTSILNPQKGQYLTYSFEKGGKFDIFGKKQEGLSFTRWIITGAKYLPVAKDRIIAARGFYGEFKKESSIKTFESEQFPLGGANSLRGYNEISFVGDNRLLINLEYRQNWTEKIGTALFFDAGNVFDDGETNTISDLKTGVGIGLRYFTAFAPFRFDLAYGNELIIHFNLGQTF